MKPPSPVTLILTIGSLAGALTAINVFWGDYGWITGKSYRGDHAEGAESVQILGAIDDLKQQVGFVSADIATVGQKVEGFEAMWNCDELDEALPGLRRWRDRAEPGSDNWYKADQETKAAEDRFDDLNCSDVLQK